MCLTPDSSIRNRMRWIAIVIVTVALTSDMVYHSFRRSSDLVGIYDLGIIGVLLFLAAGEKINKFSLNKSGFSLEQQITQTAIEARELDRFAKGEKLGEFEEFIVNFIGHERDVWSQLIIYRLGIRLLLRSLSQANGISISQMEPLSKMLGALHEKNVLPDDLVIKIERVRNTTFFLEWGSGSAPKADEIAFALKESPSVIQHLQRLLPLGKTE